MDLVHDYEKSDVEPRLLMCIIIINLSNYLRFVVKFCF